MTRVRFFALTLLLLLPALATPGRAAGAMPDAARRAALRPAVDVSLYRRSFTPDERPVLRLSGFNVKRAGFAVYPLSLPALLPTSRAMDSMAARVGRVDVQHQAPLKAWSFAFARTYPDRWAEGQVTLPLLPRGVYLVVARAGGAEKRTWLAVTETALVAKRSGQSVLVYAALAHSGAPVAGLGLTLTDALGRRTVTRTDARGLARISAQSVRGSAWAYGADAHGPAFILSAAPPAADPFAVYALTDRPLYRPGQTVQFKATVRRRQDGAVPGGFAYRTEPGQKVTVEVRDATDALIEARTVVTNAFGSVGGSLLLSDAPTLGRWQLVVKTGAQRSYAGFAVQEYRKPEYTVAVHVPAAHVLGGATVPMTIDAQYVFGQAVAGATVAYSVAFEAQNGDKAERSFEGQGVTDGQGRLVVQVPTKRLPNDRLLQVHATVTDLSRRPEQADGSVLVTAGAFRLALSTDQDAYKPGERVAVSVHASDYDDKPVSASVKVTWTETRYDRKHRPYQDKSVRTVGTDAKGNGTVSFTPLRPGEYQVDALAFDSADDPITAEDDVSVSASNNRDSDDAAVSLTPTRTSYRPGDTALVALHTILVDAVPGKGPFPAAYALVTLEGERLYDARVVTLTARTTTLRVPLSAMQFPSASLHVTIVQDKHVYEQEASLPVAGDAEQLRVSLVPDSTRHRPGEAAAYTITTRSSAGAPVGAEVSLGIVAGHCR